MFLSQNSLTTGELASHNHINCIYNVNNANYNMALSAIRLKDTSAYSWINISTATDITTAGGTGGDPCGITKNAGSGNAHNNLTPFVVIHLYIRIA